MTTKLTAEHLLILGLESFPSSMHLSDAYRRAMKKWHPDRFHNDPVMLPTATEYAKKINAAFLHLSGLLDSGPLPNSTPTSDPERTCSAPPTYSRQPFASGFRNSDVIEIFVQSSAIISTGYDRPSRTLFVKFRNGRVYAYLHVPESVFSAFLAAKSYGSFLNRHVLWQFAYEPLN